MPADLKVDLHCHSTASDGTLPPAGVVARAAAQEVELLALTDHDTTDGLEAAYTASREHGIHLLPGIEISVTWRDKLLHIVGLGIDPEHPPLQKGLLQLRDLREGRAEEIGRRLARAGIPGALDGARRHAGDGMVTRTHFARYLLEAGVVTEMQEVFDRYLARGKPGYYRVDWAALDAAIGWITGSGGIAVVAHPLRYRLTTSWLNRVLEAFRAAGGCGVEVVCGRHSRDDIERAAGFARRHGLEASAGSDFHEPGPWIELGRLGRLPDGLMPVWHRWQAQPGVVL